MSQSLDVELGGPDIALTLWERKIALETTVSALRRELETTVSELDSVSSSWDAVKSGLSIEELLRSLAEARATIRALREAPASVPVSDSIDPGHESASTSNVEPVVEATPAAPPDAATAGQATSPPAIDHAGEAERIMRFDRLALFRQGYAEGRAHQQKGMPKTQNRTKGWIFRGYNAGFDDAAAGFDDVERSFAADFAAFEVREPRRLAPGGGPAVPGTVPSPAVVEAVLSGAGVVPDAFVPQASNRVGGPESRIETVPVHEHAAYDHSSHDPEVSREAASPASEGDDDYKDPFAHPIGHFDGVSVDRSETQEEIWD